MPRPERRAYGRISLIWVHVALFAGVLVLAIFQRSNLPSVRSALDRPETSWFFVSFIAASGFLAMAALEVIKRVTNVRGEFYRRGIESFLVSRDLDAMWSGRRRRDNDSDYRPERLDKDAALSRSRIRAQLQELLGGSDLGDHSVGGMQSLLNPRSILAIYAEPIEQVAGQLGAAIDVALLNPVRYRHFLVGLTGLAPSRLFDLVGIDEAEDVRIDESTERAEHGIAEGRRPGPGVDESAELPPPNPEADALAQSVAEAASVELAQRVRSGIDLMQISVGRWWRWNVRAAAVWLSGLAGLALLHVGDLGPRYPRDFAVGALVLGGFFAWLARDIVAVVERWRR